MEQNKEVQSIGQRSIEGSMFRMKTYFLRFLCRVLERKSVR